ncbi:ArnT family glycosyltransferase [Limnoglobus roseus]|uniref:Putative glycosyltransferase n=1 Tax=Limnoglobus roseus TaxID=2598579 RepID=A0A5C1AAT9_9BACT|nr:glycosyltransferase family 39 protein [Limnoglobus roseus]QEL15293.1 putative glycosyltransferase [Limnoglobus roseus]
MRPSFLLPILLLLAVGVHLRWRQPTEPYFSGDETRHVMTGVFVHDALRDGGVSSPRAYAERYYAQYPCLGLLVWPPGFYAVEGVAMLAVGPSHETARNVLLLYLLVTTAYGFKLVHHTHGTTTAVIASLLLMASREVFINTRGVMLEVPTLACLLGAMFHFEKYLGQQRRRDLLLFAFWTVAAGLHRYDAVFLAPLFLVGLGFARQLRLVFGRDVLAAVTGILAALAPVYWLAYKTVGQQHALGATTGTNLTIVRHGWEQITYYPTGLIFQLGAVTAAFGVVGLLASFRRESWAKSRPYWALVVVVYGCFVLLAEQETRHTIYWLPAWCVFAAEAALIPLRRFGKRGLTALAVVLVVGDAGCWTLRQPVPWVRGYADAARFVLDRTDGPGIVLFDGHFDGTFIYEVRTQDAARRLWVARGDKLLYAVKSDPGAAYVEWAKDEAAIAKVLDDLGPNFIVVEEPPLKYTLPAQLQLRKVLREYPDRFERVAVMPIDSHNIEWMEGSELWVYQPKNRPAGPRKLNIPMLWGGRDISQDVK